MKKILPIQSESHRQEDLSKRKFEDLLSPWLVRRWEEKDYGIDASVEITEGIENEADRYVTGKFFNVQLKSSKKKPLKSGERTVVVASEKVTYWAMVNSPVMVAYFDELTSTFYYRWVNQELITELTNRTPNWRNNEKVTIRFIRELAPSLQEVEDDVYAWKIQQQRNLPPGMYFEIDTSIRKIVGEVLKKAIENQDEFLSSTLNKIARNLSKSIYSIAVVGESRTGKSTLINAMLERIVTPIGTTKTTGVPIAILPGDIEECIINFKDKKSKKGKLDLDFVKKYASQKENPRNKKRVQQIDIRVINPNLERGICIFDIPGFNDANDDIRDSTKSILYTIDAVVYVINGGAMEEGEFILSKSIITDLKSLCKEQEHVFIVVNKIDKITKSETFEELKSEIANEFKQYNLNKLVPDSFLYISARNSFEQKDLGAFATDTNELNQEIWRYLLKNNKTGLQRLNGGLNNLKAVIKQANELQKVRHINGAQRAELEVKLNTISGKIKDLNKRVFLQKPIILKKIAAIIKPQCDSIINNLESQMLKMPISQPLFSAYNIERYLKEEAFKVVGDTQKELNQEMAKLQNYAYREVQQILSLTTVTNSQTFNNEQSNQYYWLVKSEFNASQSNNLFQALFQASAAIITGIFGGLERLFIGGEKQRSQKIAKIKKTSLQKYNKVFHRLFRHIDAHLEESVNNLLRNSTIQSNLYLNSLRKKIEEAGEPISAEELQKLDEYIKVLDDNLLEIDLISPDLYKFL